MLRNVPVRSVPVDGRGMEKTPLSNRLHIGIFGRRNVGKSSLINALTGQDAAIVSEIPGTTTDPVYKAMEIHEIGPVVLVDTGGIDDTGDLGRMRIEKTKKVLNKSDIMLLVVDKEIGLTEYEEMFLKEAKVRKIPVVVAVNKIDISSKNGEFVKELDKKGLVFAEVCALHKTGIEELRKKIIASTPEDYERKVILQDMLLPGDLVIIVAPLDIEAPKGRLKLAQMQACRDILDNSCSVMLVKEDNLGKALSNLKIKPRMIVSESHIFARINKEVPNDIPITTFSILFARYKGELAPLIEGAKFIDSLKAGDRILIAEACTHHPIGEDIGRIIIPESLRKRLGFKEEELNIDYATGYDFPADLSAYKLIIHCGACMLNRREVLHRINLAQKSGIPITNYGMVLAYFCQALDRVTELFAKA